MMNNPVEKKYAAVRNFCDDFIALVNEHLVKVELPQRESLLRAILSNMPMRTDVVVADKTGTVYIAPKFKNKLDVKSGLITLKVGDERRSAKRRKTLESINADRSVGKKIRELRKQFGWTQEQMSDSVRLAHRDYPDMVDVPFLSASAISKIECGNRTHHACYSPIIRDWLQSIVSAKTAKETALSDPTTEEHFQILGNEIVEARKELKITQRQLALKFTLARPSGQVKSALGTGTLSLLENGQSEDATLYFAVLSFLKNLMAVADMDARF